VTDRFSISAIEGKSLSAEQQRRGVWWSATIATASGHPFVAEIVSNRLLIHPQAGDDVDWYDMLNEPERVALFGHALEYFRQYSPEPNGMKVAAAAIIENTHTTHNADRHLAYISFNIRNCASQHIKNCAEASIMGAMDRDLQRHVMGTSVLDTKPFRQIVDEWHVLGGEKATSKNNQDKIAVAPCGFCTDEMAEHSTDKTQVYIHSVKDKNAEPKILTDLKTLAHIQPGNVFKTMVSYLNSNRFVKLSKDEAALQEQEFELLVDTLTKLYVSSEKPTFTSYDADLRHGLGIAAIKSAQGPQGEMDPKKMASFFHDQTLMTLYPLLMLSGANTNRDSVRTWIRDNIDMARICVFKLADGSFEFGKECRSSVVKAMSNASNATISAAIDSLPGNPIIQFYSHTFDPKNIAEGVMRTPSKDELERAYKRSVQAPGVEMGVTVFAPSPKNESAVSRNFTLDRLYPGRFAGVGMAEVSVVKGGGGSDEDAKGTEYRHRRGLKARQTARGKDSDNTIARF
jgi:cytidine deaminase